MGRAALVCSLVGIFGWQGLPLIRQLLLRIGWQSAELHQLMQLAQSWTTPGTLVALVVGTIGLFRFQSQSALVGLVLALATVLLPVLLRLYSYLLVQ